MTAGATPMNLSTNTSYGTIEGMIVNGSTIVITTDLGGIAADTSSIYKLQVGVTGQTPAALDTFSQSTISFPSFNSNASAVYVTRVLEDSSGGFLSSAALNSCSLGTTNSCSSLLTKATNTLGSPCVSAGFIFMGDYINNSIDRYTISGGASTTGWLSLTQAAAFPTGDNTRLFFTYEGDGVNGDFTPAGATNSASFGTVVPLGLGNIAASPTGMASDGKFAYVSWGVFAVNTPMTGAVQYAPVAGGSASTLYTGTSPRAVIAANGAIYWIDGANVYGQRFP
jgi:hypothetical protein